MAQVNTVSVRLSVEGAEAARAALLKLGADGEAALKRLNFDTATGSSKAFNLVMQEGENAARGYAAELGPLGNIAAGLGPEFLVAGAAIGGFIALEVEATKVAEAHAQAMRGIESIIRVTGDASGLTAEQIDQMAERISGSTLQTRQSVLLASQELLQFGVVGADAFEKTLNAAADLTTLPAFNGDLTSAVKAIGLATEGVFTQLQRNGVKLSDSQKDQIVTFEKSGDQAAALSLLLADLGKSMQGVAKSQDEGLTGASHRLGEAWDRLLEDMGQTNVKGGWVENAYNRIADVAERVDRVGKSTGFLNVLAMAATGWFGGTTVSQMDEMLKGSGAYDVGVPADADDAFSRDVTAQGKQYDDWRAGTQKGGDDYTKDYHQKALEALKPMLVQEIDKAIAEGAKTAGVTLDIYKNDPRFADDRAKNTADATTMYDAKNAGKWAKQDDAAQRKLEETRSKWDDLLTKLTDDYAKSDAEQKALLDKSVDDLIGANSAKVAAADAFNVESLKGQSGYYDALEKQASDAYSAQNALIEAEYQKAIADLEVKRTAAIAAGEDTSKIISAEWNTYYASLAKQGTNAVTLQKTQYDILREQAGALGTYIDMANADWSQSLKTVAADGLNELDSSIIGVLKHTETLGAALKNLAIDIPADLAKQAIDKNIIGPLGAALNTAIGGSVQKDGQTDQSALIVQLAGTSGTPGASGGASGLFGNLFGGGGGFSSDSSILSQNAGFGAIDAIPDKVPTSIGEGGGFLDLIGSLFSGWAGGHVPGYADGIVRGPGGPKDDKVLSWLSNGESVMTAEATDKYGPLLKAMNQGLNVPHYADGMVDSNAGSFPNFRSTLGTESQFRGKANAPAMNLTMNLHNHWEGAVDAKTLMAYADQTGKAGGQSAIKAIKEAFPDMMVEAQGRYL